MLRELDLSPDDEAAAPVLPEPPALRPILVATDDEVDKLVRAARAGVALLSLQLRTVQAEAAVAIEDDERDLDAARGFLTTSLELRFDARRREMAAELDDARTEAARVVASARAEAAELVSVASEETLAVLLAGTTPPVEPVTRRPVVYSVAAPVSPTPTVPPVVVAAVAAPAPVAEPVVPAVITPVPPFVSEVAEPEAPAVPPVVAVAVAAPAPAEPVEPAVIVPLVAPEPDTAFVPVTPAAPVAPPASSTAEIVAAVLAATAAVPAVVAPVPGEEPPAQKQGWVKSFFHPDVIFPMIAVLVVIVILAAWVG